MKAFYSVLSGAVVLTCAAPAALAFVSENDFEFAGTGDFNGDGRPDAVIVDKVSGKYRLGYQTGPGTFLWANVRKSGMENISGVSIGTLLKKELETIAVANPDANEVRLIEATDPAAPGKTVAVMPSTLGPSQVVAIDIGGGGNTPLLDLYISTIFNVPDAHQLSLVRNDGAAFEPMSDIELKGELVQGRRMQLKTGAPALAAGLIKGDKTDTFRVDDLSGGKVVTVLEAPGFEAGTRYTAGHFRGEDLAELVFFKPGGSRLIVRAAQEVSGGKYELRAEQSFDLGKPLRHVVAAPVEGGWRLVVFFGEGEEGGVYEFDGEKAPKLAQSLAPEPNEALNSAAVERNQLVLLSGLIGKKFSYRYQVYTWKGSEFAPGQAGDLPTLDEVDVAIHAQIMAKLAATQEADMKPYTNTIPGTQVSYTMIPVHGGEFIMGSPDSEPGHKPDESPQRKVRVEPFWMGKCEITWNEFQLFMYPDEERKFKGTLDTDPNVDAISDAVTRPTKPYTEMSFGMGKDGFPAIAMTHHAANKYCQWLSAKTGEFYRLPTEAEWEYACRASTTTAYSFGDDPNQLEDYAWYGKNSDWKYQKVGKKKPNPWGLHDMHGNIAEWCLDQYAPDYYQKVPNPVAQSPWNKAVSPYPHSVRGGSWDDDDPMALRSAARRGSERAWKMQDPQLPKSIWYFSDAQFVGFRIIRPLKVPPPEVLSKYWTSGTERD